MRTVTLTFSENEVKLLNQALEMATADFNKLTDDIIRITKITMRDNPDQIEEALRYRDTGALIFDIRMKIQTEAEKAFDE